MDCGDNFTSNILEQLHMANMKEAYQSTNKVNYVLQMLKHNNHRTRHDYIKKTLSCFALQVYCDTNFANDFNLLSITDKSYSTYRANLFSLEHYQNEPFFHSVSQQLYHFREMHVTRVCQSIKLTSLRDTSVDFRISILGQLFHTQYTILVTQSFWIGAWI